MPSWSLTRTMQCVHCPWRKEVDPYDIPNGYSREKHRALCSTIAAPGSLDTLYSDEPFRVMACHETENAYCIGWLSYQIGPGNNILLRMRMLHCTNAKEIRLRGEQHATFEETLPRYVEENTSDGYPLDADRI